MSGLTIAVVGNPNCGKSTLFNALTGARQRVGNWPGVTVERKTGAYRWQGETVNVVDLPGTYSLSATQNSIDERIGLEYAISGEADVIVNIIDASNLERHLYLTTQLLELRVPLVVVLNMMDMATQAGLAIDASALAEKLACPVVPMVASRESGLEELKQAVAKIGGNRTVPATLPSFGEVVEREIERVAPLLPTGAGNARWRLLQMFDGDLPRLTALPLAAASAVRKAMADIERETGEDLDILLADRRYGFAAETTAQVVERPREASRSLTNRIDRVVLDRFLGIPIFLAMMYLMFMWTINLGSAFIDFFDMAVGSVMVEGLGHFLWSIGAPDWVRVILADGLGGGLRTIASFIPVIAFLYLFLSALEDSGYMARAAFVMDRFMRSIGLPGKAFVPLIVGFGCNVPAVMATRTLENDADRKAAVMMSPFMSCGARLPVYALFAAAFFPTNGQNIVFGLYIIGIGVAVMTGFLLRTTLLKGDVSPLVMELPPYHLPTIRNILIHSWDRLQSFVLGAGKIIVIMVAVLSVLNLIGTDGSFGKTDPEDSVLAVASRSIVPVFEPMGIDDHNWPAVVGVVSGVLAKEAVVGTLGSLYGSLAANGSDAGDEARSTSAIIADGLVAAFATIPENLTALADKLTDPLGISIGDVSSVEEASAEQEVSSGTYGEMARRFAGPAGAFAYLLFTLLYMPCVAATGAIYREVGPRWTGFAIAWTTGLAYGTATVFFQISRFAEAPLHAGLTIAAVLAVLACAVATIHLAGKRQMRAPLPAIAE
ncbi:Fe(2+) transporter permease subunit FeoB [Consotaella salsifontis]|uniref:Ferrous iron transport protein B n=1 Tax=Consotaella salsifontis TaxID=1365950 RepID=A0A1T4NIL3_9HYPH|nr:Fe(2+) transporter permease subunit FeoB [Consotaella salsifontis]SJZ78965.1 ferrous iron transport protein B [Consotaella salsifontis]